MKTIALTAFLLLAFGASTHAALAAGAGPLAIPLASPSAIERAVSRSLLLRITGNAEGLEVELISTKPVRGCFHNLVHRAPHGPDPSEVLPWQVAAGRFPNIRSIPVCGHALMVEISLVSPILSSDKTRFTAGELVVTIKPRNKVSNAGA
jgi:hypothetical protein